MTGEARAHPHEPMPPPALIAPAFAELLALWQTHLAARGISLATRKAYAEDLGGFLGFLAGHLDGPLAANRLGTLGIGDFRSWMAAERGRGRGGRSLARGVSAVRGFFAWLEDHEGTSCPAVHLVKTPKSDRSLPRPVDAPDAHDLLDTVESAAKEDWVGARDRAVLTLLWGAGLRISEALALRWGDAPLGETVRVMGKGGKPRSVPVLPVIAAATERYRHLCPHRPAPDGPLFLGVRGGRLQGDAVRKAMQGARAALGLPATATPHALRHAFATQLLAAGGDLRAIQTLLGHARLSTTEVYTAVDQARMAEVHAAAHPRARMRNKP